jgi:hypothetical protein
MKHSTGNRTKAEQARFDKMKEIGQCVACYQRGIHGWGYIEIHHLLSGNKRIGHMATVSLCPWHHRGVTDGQRVSCFDSGSGRQATSAELTKWIGPSLANGSKPFRTEFGTDAELLAIQNALLGETDDP